MTLPVFDRVPVPVLALAALSVLLAGCQALSAAPVSPAVDVSTASLSSASVGTMPAPQGPFDETPITPMETVGAARGE